MQRHIAYLAAIVTAFLAVPAALKAEDAAVYVARAKAHLEKREFDKAIADCDKALKLDVHSPEAFQLRARGRIGNSDWDKAIGDCDDAIKINPKFAKAYAVRGGAWVGKREFSNALADCNKAIALDAESSDAYLYRASAWLEKGEYKKALADSDQAVNLGPKSANAYRCRSEVYWRRGEYEKADSDLRQCLSLRLDDWDALNSLGVLHMKMAWAQEAKAAAAEAKGDLKAAKERREKVVALKDDAKALWLRGITANPQAWDIHSNLAYAYSEANDLEKAEFHLRKAVELKKLYPRLHNNLGRVLLRQSQEREMAAFKMEAKAKTDPAVAANVKGLREEAKTKLDEAIVEFKMSAQLDPTLLEARLNLGEVYTQLGKYDEAKKQYLRILDLDNPSVVEKDAIANFSQAYFGLARIAFAKSKPDEGFADLKQSITKNPGNMAALERLARELFLRDKYHDGEHALWLWFSRMPPMARPAQAQRFAAQLANERKQPQALRALGFAAWIFATSPEPKLRNPQEAGEFGEQLVRLSKRQDPLALDTFAAAAAANGRFDIALQAAQDAIKLATAQGDIALADMISRRLLSYQNHKPYLSNPDGSDRP